MNAYQEPQTSGNLWPPPVPVFMLDQPLHQAPVRAKPIEGNTIFDDFEKQMAAYTAEHDAMIREMLLHFVMPTDSSVTKFLSEHRSIAPLLLQAVPHLESCFGADAVFNLRAPTDESGSRTLYSVAMWPGKAQDVRNALAKFDRDWWMSHAGQAAGLLTFTYELI
jgi:hypothetical protein